MTDAGRSSMRNWVVSGAWSASATTTLIGVTWLATTTVRPAWRVSSRSRAASTRSCTITSDSPPPGRSSSDPIHLSSAGRSRRRHLVEGQSVPGAELHLGEARLLLERHPEAFGEDLAGLEGAAYG